MGLSMEAEFRGKIRPVDRDFMMGFVR
ncbi:MAG: hypothetical protein ACI974_000587 [Paraglaciecola sp.]|jgi:hypothetical protein